MQEKSLRVDLERWTPIIVGPEGSVQGNRGFGPRFPDSAVARPWRSRRTGGSTLRATRVETTRIGGDRPLLLATRASDDGVRGHVRAEHRVAIALDHPPILAIRTARTALKQRGVDRWQLRAAVFFERIERMGADGHVGLAPRPPGEPHQVGPAILGADRVEEHLPGARVAGARLRQ